jgi:hypothetical protein
MGIHGFNVGQLSIDPQVFAFFLLVIVHWYWIGQKIERRISSTPQPSSRKPAFLIALYGLGGAWWIMRVITTVLNTPRELVSWHPTYIWHYAIYPPSCLLWSASLAIYFSRSFVLGFRSKRKPQ